MTWNNHSKGTVQAFCKTRNRYHSRSSDPTCRPHPREILTRKHKRADAELLMWAACCCFLGIPALRKGGGFQFKTTLSYIGRVYLKKRRRNFKTIKRILQ